MSWGTSAPFRRSPPFSRCWPAYAALWAANRRQIRKTPEKPRSKAPVFRAFLCVGECLAPRFTYSWKFGAGFRPAGFLPVLGNRGQAFSLPGKTEAVPWACTRKKRVRARRRERKDRVRDLLGAAAGVRDAGKKRHGARLAHRRCAHRRCVNSGCGLRRWCAGSRGPCDCRACRGTRHKPF